MLKNYSVLLRCSLYPVCCSNSSSPHRPLDVIDYGSEHQLTVMCDRTDHSVILAEMDWYFQRFPHYSGQESVC